ncbi:right-handed parallel beta-helix repeat-containing protein [Mesorhizobium yinganensis]|uniref:right-handed parallel beta-helix repeat-containing protein n=1 Tax=Mesorhizobium yinganensis TaxID=3157707 RepID=UPI0032B728D5
MAIPAGFPDASTTGVPDGTVLTSYTGPSTITKDGTVIENKIIDGSLIVSADNVIIRNCKINYNGWWGIDAEGAKNITIQNCDIVGPGYGGDSNAGILGSGTFLRNDISKSENGIVLQGGASTVKGNYIHDLEDGAGDPHYDGISVQGGQNGVLIEDNTVIGRDTSDVFIKNDFGPISNVTVNHNYLAGNPGINIYVDGRASGGPITGVTITNNYLEKGYYGYYSVDNSSPVISDNIEYLPGEAPPVIPGYSFAGTAGNDFLPLAGQSTGGNDILRGLGGNDVLIGGRGADTIDGGTGIDTASYATSNAGVRVSLYTGTTAGGDANVDTLLSIENLTGSRYSDILVGNNSANVLRDGSSVGDLLKGLGGNDTYQVYSANTVIAEGAGNGTADRVMAGVDYKLGAGVYVEVLSTNGTAGTDRINLTGNALHQEILGNAGANVLRDGGGVGDVLKGLGGNDIYQIYSSATTIVETSSSDKADHVMAAVDYQLGAGVRVEILSTNGSTDTSPITLIGNEFAQRIFGNAGDNRLEGREGNDTLRGFGGDDTFVFNTKLGSSNVDTVLDFHAADDRFLLSDNIFTALTPGTLAATAFRANTTGLAGDATDRIIYETDTGKLFYDADGLGGSAGIHFATLTGTPSITNADFSVA